VIRVICSKCGTPANLPDNAAGKMALCKCGQKNPIPKPAGPSQPVAPQGAPPAARPPAVPQAVRPQGGRPGPAAPAQYSPASSAPGAPPDDDLALQELDQETGAEKNAAPVPCPACEKPLPAGEIVCRHCGYIAQEGVIGKEKRIVSKARAVTWATKKASELTVADFLKVAVSPQLFSTLIMLILRSILATALTIGIAIGLFFAAPLYLPFLVGMPPIVSLLATWGVGILISSLVYGLVVKEAFALCQAACFAYDSPRVKDWPTTRSGFLFLLLNWMPTVAGLVAAAGGGPVAGAAAFAVTALLIAPVTFLSIAQSGGEWSGLNPVRIFTWIPKLLIPYLGILALIAVETAAIAVLTFLGAKAIGVTNLLAADPSGKVVLNFAVVGMAAGVLLVSVILSLHPLVYMAAMLGMLYRKYEKELLR